MKIKLLKIVRKRYEIIKYIHISCQNFPLLASRSPVWKVIDHRNLHKCKIYKSYDDAYLYLIDLIRNEYYKKVLKRSKINKNK